MRIVDNVVKTRKAPIGFAGSDRTLELQVAKIKGGSNAGEFQATYYDGADRFIWGDCRPTAELAIKHVDALLDQWLQRCTYKPETLNPTAA